MADYQAALTSALSGGGKNPYLQEQGDNITRTVNDNLQRNIMPAIGQAATGAGQYGGSRQGIAQGIAAGDASNNIAGQLSNLYGNAYNSDRTLQANTAMQLSGQDHAASIAAMNNATQNKSLDNQYNLGLGSLGLQSQGQQNSFYTANRGQDLQQYQLGSQLYGQGVQGNLGIGQTQYGIGQQAQNNQYGALNQYSQNLAPYTGLNSAHTQTGSSSGGGATGIIGGALAGAQLFNNWNTPSPQTGYYNGSPGSGGVYGANNFMGPTN